MHLVVIMFWFCWGTKAERGDKCAWKGKEIEKSPAGNKENNIRKSHIYVKLSIYKKWNKVLM